MFYRKTADASGYPPRAGRARGTAKESFLFARGCRASRQQSVARCPRRRRGNGAVRYPARRGLLDGTAAPSLGEVTSEIRKDVGPCNQLHITALNSSDSAGQLIFLNIRPEQIHRYVLRFGDEPQHSQVIRISTSIASMRSRQTISSGSSSSPAWPRTRPLGLSPRAPQKPVPGLGHACPGDFQTAIAVGPRCPPPESTPVPPQEQRGPTPPRPRPQARPFWPHPRRPPSIARSTVPRPRQRGRPGPRPSCPTPCAGSSRPSGHGGPDPDHAPSDPRPRCPDLDPPLASTRVTLSTVRIRTLVRPRPRCPDPDHARSRPPGARKCNESKKFLPHLLRPLPGWLVFVSGRSRLSRPGALQ